MKKILFGVVLFFYAIIAIFVTICMLSFNEYHILETSNNYYVVNKGMTEEFENGSIVKFSKTDKCEDLKEGEEVYYIVSANTLLKGNVGPRTENMDSDALTISEHNIKCNQMLGKTNEYKVYSSWGNIIDFLTNRYIYLFVILLPTIALCVYEVYLLKNRNSKSE